MKQVPFARMGLTAEQFEAEVARHHHLNQTLPRVISSKDIPFFDWEADAISRIREHFKGDEHVLCLLSAMSQLVKKEVKRQNAENAAKNASSRYRSNTIGMFYTPKGQPASI